MRTRICDFCGLEKSIRGVWYLMAPRFRTTGEAPFQCETCFRSHEAEAKPA